MSAEAEVVRVGFIGCGRIADLQCLGYLEHPRARIVAVCDSEEALARQRADAWGAEHVYGDYRRLLDDESLDAVEILTPHHLHAEHAIAALEAGKHVSLQKPPARTLAEHDAIAATAARSGKKFRVFENFSYYPPHVRAKELVEQGAIGTPLSIRIKTAAGRPEEGWTVGQGSLAWRARRAECGGGATTFDHGYHCFHMARYFIPVSIERVHAFIHWTSFGEDLWYDGPAVISWKYAGEPARFGSWEVVASLGMKVRSQYYVSDDRMEIHGSEGVLWVNRCTGRLLEEPALVVYREGETRAFHDLATDWAESFRIGTKAFIDAIIEGRPVALDADDARQTLAVALAVQVSAAEGREVSIAELSVS